MGRTSKKEYLWAIRNRYQRAGRRFKGKILNEFIFALFQAEADY